jgi:hypothetical protein
MSLTVDPNFSKLASLTDGLKRGTMDIPTTVKAIIEAIATIEALLRKNAGLPPQAE